MSTLQIKLNDGTAFDINSFNDSYIGIPENGMEDSDKNKYRTICQLADKDIEIDEIINKFTNENLSHIVIMYVNNSNVETEQIAYDNLKMVRVNKYFSINDGELSSGYDVVLEK